MQPAGGLSVGKATNALLQLAVFLTAVSVTTVSIWFYLTHSQTTANASAKRSSRRSSKTTTTTPSDSMPPNEGNADRVEVETQTLEPREVVYLNNPDACYDFEIGKAEDSDEFEDVKHVAKVILKKWSDALDDDIVVKIICGGITNRLFRLVWKDESVLVRIYGDNTEAFIDRSDENKVFAWLSTHGFAPTYFGRFGNGRIEGYLASRPLEPEEMGQLAPVNFLSLISKELARMHIMKAPLDQNPVLWTKLERFETLACGETFNDPVKAAGMARLNVPSMRQELRWLKSVLPSSLNRNGQALLEQLEGEDEITRQAFAFASDVVFCHNDVLSGNLLFNDSWDRVQIIDYEYGGYNYRAFDFANHFCEHCGFDLDLNLYPDQEKQFAFFSSYMAAAAPALWASLQANKESKAFLHALYSIVNQYALAAHLFWGFWSIVQAAHSKIDFDFVEYAQKRFDGYKLHKKLFFPSK